MYTYIHTYKTWQSNSGFIYANQSKGKPIKLMPVSQPQTGSSCASSSTLKKRSQVIEKFVESVASATKAADDVIHQTATSIKRNKDQFLKSFSEGGLNIIQSFTLKQVSNNYCTKMCYLESKRGNFQLLNVHVAKM